MFGRRSLRWISTLLASGALLVASPPAPAGATPYVALGDSYASGEGVPPFLPGTATDLTGGQPRNTCHRATAAYPMLVGPPVASRACSGAVVADMAATNHDGNAGEGPQLDALGLDTVLATVMIGGNDAGFSTVIRACITTTTCRADNEAKVAAALQVLASGKLAALYQQIGIRAPGALVLVVGYPLLFPAAVGGSCQLIAPADVAWLHSVGQQLDDVIAAQAAAAGVSYLDPGPAFAGHDVCGGSSWFNGLVFNPTVFSFHPNALGQTALAVLVRGAAAGIAPVAAPAAPAAPAPVADHPDTTPPQLVIGRRGLVRARARAFRVRLGCPRSEISCSGSLTLLAGRAGVVGVGRFELAGGTTALVPVKLRRRLGPSATRVELRVRVHDAAGNTLTLRRTLVVPRRS